MIKIPAASLALLIIIGLVTFRPGELWAGHGSEDDVTTVTAEQVKLILDSREKTILIDLRPSEDFHKGRLPGARSLPLKELDKRYREIPRADRVILYCECPQNQIIEEVYLFLKDYGYRNTAVMADGFQGWIRRKFPVETGHR